MTCEKCKIKRATVFFTEADRSRHSMCEGCAQQYKNRELGTGEKESSEPNYVPLLDLFEYELSEAVFFGNAGGKGKRKCAVCGLSEEELFVRGELGCPDCYETFSELLPSVNCARIRMPSAEKKRSERILLIRELRERLGDAVSGEDFETAARLRDRIKELEKEA